MNGIKAAFAVTVALSGAAFVFIWFTPWKKLQTNLLDEAPVVAV
jgi:hypothetical protein